MSRSRHKAVYAGGGSGTSRHRQPPDTVVRIPMKIKRIINRFIVLSFSKHKVISNIS